MEKLLELAKYGCMDGSMLTKIWDHKKDRWCFDRNPEFKPIENGVEVQDKSTEFIYIKTSKQMIIIKQKALSKNTGDGPLTISGFQDRFHYLYKTFLVDITIDIGPVGPIFVFETTYEKKQRMTMSMGENALITIKSNQLTTSFYT
ncbi:MAG: hypothetical protein K0U41_07095 [Gammaproteobacteria bacterium]|nr:hypothetical protein [Gammaproteobacteria bacterium]